MGEAESSRNMALDAAKGLAIILVVFGHAIARNTADAADIWYWQAIHHFHMPLFMFVSGYITYDKVGKRWLLRRFLQLIPVYIAWSFVLYYGTASPFSGYAGIYPTDGGLIRSFLTSTATLNLSALWFFPALLVIFTFAYLSRGKWPVMLAMVFVLYTISQLPVPHMPYSISLLAWFMPFFICGYMFSRYKERLRKFKLLRWIALAGFPVCFVLGGSLNYYDVPIYSWFDYTSFLQWDMLVVLYRLAMALLGIGMVFAIVDLLVKVKSIRPILLYLGTITLGIYASHLLWMKIGIGNGIVMELTATVVAILISVGLIWILRRFRITDYLFLGGAQKLVPNRASAT